jgi:hypothetical protein
MVKARTIVHQELMEQYSNDYRGKDRFKDDLEKG